MHLSQVSKLPFSILISQPWAHASKIMKPMCCSIHQNWFFHVYRYMQFISSAIRSYYVSTQIFSITPKTFSRYLGWVAQWTWHTSKSTTMEVILQSIHLESFLKVRTSITTLHTTEVDSPCKVLSTTTLYTTGIILSALQNVLCNTGKFLDETQKYSIKNAEDM